MKKHSLVLKSHTKKNVHPKKQTLLLFK